MTQLFADTIISSILAQSIQQPLIWGELDPDKIAANIEKHSESQFGFDCEVTVRPDLDNSNLVIHVWNYKKGLDETRSREVYGSVEDYTQAQLDLRDPAAEQATAEQATAEQATAEQAAKEATVKKTTKS